MLFDASDIARHAAIRHYAIHLRLFFSMPRADDYFRQRDDIFEFRPRHVAMILMSLFQLITLMPTPLCLLSSRLRVMIVTAFIFS